HSQPSLGRDARATTNAGLDWNDVACLANRQNRGTPAPAFEVAKPTGAAASAPPARSSAWSPKHNRTVSASEGSRLVRLATATPSRFAQSTVAAAGAPDERIRAQRFYEPGVPGAARSSRREPSCPASGSLAVVSVQGADLASACRQVGACRCGPRSS